MNRRNFLDTIAVGAVLAVPGAARLAWAGSRPQDDEKQAHENKEHAKKEEKAAKAERKVRVYDAKHKQYHDWDDTEDSAYRRYLAEKHEDYREFQRLSADEQERYWDWRHAHEDTDDGRHDRDHDDDRHEDHDR